MENQNQKKAEFIKLKVDSSQENDVIYVTGQTYDPNNAVYNPDIWLAKFESGFNNANEPDGILQWQKAIAGISGSTRRDYITTICLLYTWEQHDAIHGTITTILLLYHY